MGESTPDPLSDKDFVDAFIGHLAQPCGTDAGNLRGFYINEAESVLERNAVVDPTERARLESAIRMAIIFRDAESR